MLPILEQLPSQLLVDAGEVLGQRGQHIAMTDVVGVLHDTQVARILDVLSNDALGCAPAWSSRGRSTEQAHGPEGLTP